MLLGPSGSGKTTLLSVLGCLLAPDQGTVEIDGVLADFSSQQKLTELRRKHIGFVFQHSQLLPFLTARDNLAVVAANAGLSRQGISQRVGELVDYLGLSSCDSRKPHELSGGQRQRFAIARALLHRPTIILADEPTAALDWTNGQAAISLLSDQARLQNAALLVVTHDTRLIPAFDRAIHIDSGVLSNT